MKDYAVFEGGNTLTVEKIDDEKYEISVCSIRTGMSCVTISRKAVQEFASALNNLSMSSVLDIAEIDYMIALADKNMKDKNKGRKQLGIDNENYMKYGIPDIDRAVEIAANNLQDKIEGRKQLGIKNETNP